ncbi:monocarboxylate transporter 12-like [Ixodes scapularis]|uniref:monocarboxylate transporter 12-like n=1 Tax=Ixodes scapularis TaxID=6945 RepID=UPI001A9F217B|nr:monocarboxylate transporter 12-like [Ixodes scapularis]
MGGLFAWVGVVASAFVPNMAWMTVTLGVINGLGVGITTMTYSILLPMYFDKYRGLTSGMKYAGASSAGLVFPKLLAYLQEEYGFRGTLLICGGIIMHVSAIGIFVKEPPWTSLKSIAKDAKNTTKERSVEIQNISVNTQELHDLSTTVPREQVKKHRPALVLLANPMLYIIISMAVVADFTGAAYVSTIVDYGVDKGLSINDAESLIIYGSCSEIVGRLLLPLLADKGCFRRTTLVMATLFIWGCSMMLFPHSSLQVHIILVCLCAYLSYGCLQSMRSVLMADYIGVQWISICYGLSGLVLVPLNFCSPSITGFFRDSGGSYDGLYRFHGGVQLVVGALFLPVVFVERRHASLWTLKRSTEK